MRSLRWLLLAAIVFVAAAVVGTYRGQRRNQRAHRRPVPPPVALDTKTAALDWEWGQSANGLPQVHISAKDMKQSADGDKADLQQIELRIYQKDGLHYDRIRSASAQFSTKDTKLFSPGEAAITLDVPVNGDPPHPLTSITAAGINFDSKTGQAVSDQHVSFTFENGDGTCTGAAYDPATHTLNLNKDVVMNLRGKGPQSKPMKVEAGQLKWDEAASSLLLYPSSRLTRGDTVINAGASTVQMADHEIRFIDAPNGHGTDQQPNRSLEYSANMIHVDFNDDGAIGKMSGTGDGKVISHAAGSETSITGNRFDLTFVDDQVLSMASSAGNAMLESKPAPDPAGDTPDVKVLKADLLVVHMKPGGKEIGQVNTEAPGTLEFLPSQDARRRRLLKAERMAIAYGDNNEIQSFHAIGGAGMVSTETYPSEAERRKKSPGLATAFTTSRTIDATFGDHGQLIGMKQLGSFRYGEGNRKAQSQNATLENDRNVMNLESGARISDDTGSTSADTIQIDQNTGDFDAKGHVFTTRLPDQNPAATAKKPESAMLDDTQPTQGSAERVISGERNRLIHYAGNAVVWQSGNRIQAERIDIDRGSKSIVADGKVITQFEDAGKPGVNTAPVQPVFTIVHAEHMVYTDSDRMANYTGGVDFAHAALTVKSAALKAYLNEKDSGKDSRLNRALGDGKVEIVDIAPDRRRVGTSEHAEYFTDEGKVILTGGEPQLRDTRRGNTRGDQLTYFTSDERLLVNGAPDRPVKSHLRKKS